MTSLTRECQLLVIGGGPGGLACARHASAKYGTDAIVVEVARIGGTCVNVGCKPKKVTWNAASIQSTIHDAKAYRFDTGKIDALDWASFKAKRDGVVLGLNKLDTKALSDDKVAYLHGLASFTDPHTVKVIKDDKTEVEIKAEHILIAVGGYPNLPPTEGAEHGITSDGFFELERLPKKVAVVGAGYIAVEMAGMLNAFGCETHMFIRQDKILRTFDQMVQDKLAPEYEQQGVIFHKNTTTSNLQELANGTRRLHFKDHSGKTGSLDCDTVLWAIGRSPQLSKLNLDIAKVEVDKKSRIKVDAFQNTNVANIYALGDACDSGFDLTPVAMAAGRALADRLFGGRAESKIEYSMIPTVVFAHPEVGSIGMTEAEARDKFGDKVKVYTSDFLDLYYAVMEPGEQIRTSYKLVCSGEEERVVGLHIVGRGSSEVLQGFGVAVKLGATKADFDRCVAIHPTSAEELVTMK